MKNVLICFYFTIFSMSSLHCFYGKIIYSYPDQVMQAIDRGVRDTQEKFRDVKRHNLFITIKNSSETTLVISTDFKMDEGVVSLVKRTNRFLKVGGKKIPIIFQTDFNDTKIKTSNRIMLSGYRISYDYYYNIIAEGPIF
jgi:hypothetical protein